MHVRNSHAWKRPKSNRSQPDVIVLCGSSVLHELIEQRSFFGSNGTEQEFARSIGRSDGRYAGCAIS